MKQQQSSEASDKQKDLLPAVDDDYLQKFMEASKIIDKTKEEGQITDNEMLMSLMNDNARKSMAAGSPQKLKMNETL